MQQTAQKANKNRTLRDFTRLVIAFFGTLVVLGFYQQISLYYSGVLDGIFGRSLVLLTVHHIGFTALVALPLAFLFKLMEAKRASRGFKMTALLLLLLLMVEGVLTEYYVRNFEILGSGFIELYASRTSWTEFLLGLAILLPLCLAGFYAFYKLGSKTYKVIGRMYPFTIILFSLFLATLYSDKKPVNENKTQYLFSSSIAQLMDFNTYAGQVEYPLLKEHQVNNELTSFFQLREEAPNLVFIILEGIGADFVGEKARYVGFTPFLNTLSSGSLYWPNHLSNSAESHASLPSVLGSLPFGEEGFTRSGTRLNRNTILGVLKKNGYITSFNYGGNSALQQWDKFLFEDRIDHMLDFKGFGSSFTKQEVDAAGISLGYPDKELYRKWNEDRSDTRPPFAEVFFSLSSKKPFQIPEQEKYMKLVEKKLDNGTWDRRTAKVIRKNKEVFASVIYTDEALAGFMELFRELPAYKNTIFIITGSHNMSELPQFDPLSRYRVPLIIHSPMAKAKQEFSELTSHADIVPSILGLLESEYNIKLPAQESFLGQGLIGDPVKEREKRIPLFRHAFNIKDYISGSFLLSDGYLYHLNDELEAIESDDEKTEARVNAEFNQFKTVNKYVVRENKIIPGDLSLFAQTVREPSKQEMIWINSVFNGTDFDNAYETARSLALDGDRERALLLCSYILNQVPGHADTEILIGRIHAWQGNYEQAMEILEGAILKYPVYADAYSALFDVYFWAGKNEKAFILQRQLERNKVENEELKEKLKRAYDQVDEKVQVSTSKTVSGTQEKYNSVVANHSE